MRFEESAIEELAIDQRPLPSGPRHEARPEIERPVVTPDEQMSRRLLERKKQALLETRARAEERLGAAEAKMRRHGAFRGGGRDALWSARESYRRAIALADERLGETERLLDESRLAITGARRGRSADRDSIGTRDRVLTPER